MFHSRNPQYRSPTGAVAAGTNVPGDLIEVLQSLMILMVSADFVIRKWKPKAVKKEGK